MKITKFIPLAMLSVVLLASCQSRESKINKLVTSHLEQSLENPENLKVLEIAEPDSAFGLNYFTKQEQAYMLGTVTNVTKVLMERTEYMTKPDLDDAYTMTLADLEMRMSTGLFSGMLGDWPTWRCVCPQDSFRECSATVRKVPGQDGKSESPISVRVSTAACTRHSDGTSSTKTARPLSEVLICPL